MIFTYELARKIAGTGVTTNCVHPGAVRTNWGTSGGPAFSFMMKIARPFLIPPGKGAEGPVYLAFSESLRDVTGRYFSRTKEAKSSEESYDEAIAKRLWQVSAETTNIPA